MIRRLIDAIYDRILADSEAARPADGYLSWQGEFHAAAWGFATGLLAGVTGFLPILLAGVGWIYTAKGNAPDWLPYPKQFAKEGAYLVGHAVAGLLIGVGFRYLFF